MTSQVIVYTFDAMSKEMTGSVSLSATADPRSLLLPPIVKGMPLNGTLVAPPKHIPPRKTAVWTGAKWNLEEDWRAVEVFDTLTGAVQRICEIGVTPPMRSLTTNPRPSPEYAWDGYSWRYDESLRLALLSARIREERNRRLIDADNLVNLALDNDADPKPARVYRQALRDITQQPAFPQNVKWPTRPG